MCSCWRHSCWCPAQSIFSRIPWVWAAQVSQITESTKPIAEQLVFCWLDKDAVGSSFIFQFIFYFPRCTLCSLTCPADMLKTCLCFQTHLHCTGWCFVPTPTASKICRACPFCSRPLRVESWRSVFVPTKIQVSSGESQGPCLALGMCVNTMDLLRK